MIIRGLGQSTTGWVGLVGALVMARRPPKCGPWVAFGRGVGDSARLRPRAVCDVPRPTARHVGASIMGVPPSSHRPARPHAIAPTLATATGPPCPQGAVGAPYVPSDRRKLFSPMVHFMACNPMQLGLGIRYRTAGGRFDPGTLPGCSFTISSDFTIPRDSPQGRKFSQGTLLCLRPMKSPPT